MASILGIVVSEGLGAENWLRLIGWLVIGFAIYFLYSRKNGLLNKPDPDLRR